MAKDKCKKQNKKTKKNLNKFYIKPDILLVSSYDGDDAGGK